jgi:hypothetical protein
MATTRASVVATETVLHRMCFLDLMALSVGAEEPVRFVFYRSVVFFSPSSICFQFFS